MELATASSSDGLKETSKSFVSRYLASKGSKVMTYAELLAWVNDPNRTQAELSAMAATLGRTTTGTVNQLRTRLRAYLASFNMADQVPGPVLALLAQPQAAAAGAPAPQPAAQPQYPTIPQPGQVPAAVQAQIAALQQQIAQMQAQGQQPPPQPPAPPAGPPPAAPATTPVTPPTPPLTITTTSPLPNGTVGVAYNQQLSATGGTAPYTWAFSGNPAGILIDTANGTLTGTPITAQTYDVWIRVSDSQGVHAWKQFTLVVEDAPPHAPPPVPAQSQQDNWWGWLLVIMLALALLAILWFALGRPGLPGPQPTQPSPTAEPAKPSEPTKPAATQPAPTATSTPVPAATAVPTQVPTTAPSPTRAPEATKPVAENHWQRLERLDAIFRSQGLEGWLKATGLSWDELKADARQIEEETSPSGKIVAAGVQVNAKNLRVSWPNVVTTDVPSRITEGPATRKHTPDLRNGSTLYTEVVANGPVTIWIDASNWGQLAPR